MVGDQIIGVITCPACDQEMRQTAARVRCESVLIEYECPTTPIRGPESCFYWCRSDIGPEH